MSRKVYFVEYYESGEFSLGFNSVSEAIVEAMKRYFVDFSADLYETVEDYNAAVAEDMKSLIDSHYIVDYCGICDIDLKD